MRGLLFFSFGKGIETWKKSGILDRELALYRALQVKGVHYDYYTYGDRDCKVDSELTVIHSHAKNLLTSFFWPFFQVRTLSRYEVFKTNQMFGSWVAVIAAVVLKKKLYVRVGYEHYQYHLFRKSSFFKRWFSFWISTLAYRSANVISVTSEPMRKFVCNTFKVSPAKVYCHSNYVDIEHFKPSTSVSKNGRLLFVGRLVEVKNLYETLKAVKRVGCGIDIIGTGVMEDELKKFAVKNNVDARFLGAIENSLLPKFINASSIFILCSLYEGNPKSLLEAMSCGATVIGSSVDGISSVVEHNENGYIVSPCEEKIAAGIDYLLNNDYERVRLGVAAREYACKRASLESLVRFEEGIFNRLTCKNA